MSKYTEDEFQQVSKALQQADPFPILHVPPVKPRTGILAYADGTNWNPGFGEGFYFYSSANAWNSMKAPSVSGYITDAPSDGTTYGRKNAAWARVLNLADGGTVTGNMVWSGTQSFSNTVGFSGTVNFTGSVTGLPAAPVLRGWIAGLTMSNAGGTSITISPGQAADSTNALLMVLALSITKTGSAWVAGNNNGGIDTGAFANNTWYHWYLISNASGSLVDAIFSLSASAPALPSGYTLYRRIGSMKSGTSAWVSFLQNGDYFTWVTPIQDFSGAIGTTAVNVTLASTPLGVIVRARVCGMGGAASYNYVSPLNVTDQAPLSTGVPGFAFTFQSFVGSMEMDVETDTSQRIRCRGAASVTVTFITRGWIDFRGKNL